MFPSLSRNVNAKIKFQVHIDNRIKTIGTEAAVRQRFYSIH